jgi:GNAT superfamily N-acetyltransferase
VDETDTPVGYIFGSADYHVFFDKMIEKYIPEMMKINIFYAYAFKLYLYFNKFYGRKYPAHMHIDITEGCRRQGAGRALADALTNALRIKNIPYLFLQTDAKNIRARAFYKSCGFKEISSLFGCVTYIFDISAS